MIFFFKDDFIYKKSFDAKEHQEFFLKLGSTKPRYDKKNVSWKIILCTDNTESSNIKDEQWAEIEVPHPKKKVSDVKKKKLISPLKSLQNEDGKLYNVFIENFKKRKHNQIVNSESIHSSIQFEDKL